MDKFNSRHGALGPTTSFPFAMATEKFDGTKPFAVLEVWDPDYDEGMTITCKTPEDFMANWTRCSNIARGEQHTWGGKYVFHAIDRPAATFYDGSTAWFRNGLVHNTEGPALEFRGGGIYCLNGQIVDPSFFDLYLDYMRRISRMRHPENRIPTFPSKYEIKEAVDNELTLYFDYQTNHYWYDRNGLLHHPTAPAYEGSDGVVQYWDHGAKIGEALEGSLKQDEVLEAVKQALDAARPPYKYHVAEDVLKSPEINELEAIFKEAGRRLLGGQPVEEVYDWFAMVYGADECEIDFSMDFKESFKERVEEIWDRIDNHQNIFKRAKPKPNLVREYDEDLKAEELMQENVDLHDKVSKMVDRANEILNAAKAFKEAGRPDEQLKLDDGLAKKMVPPMPLKYIETDNNLINAPYIPASHIPGERAEQEEKGDGGLNWGAPLGALAVAGIVGLLGAKRDATKTVAEQAEVSVVR